MAEFYRSFEHDGVRAQSLNERIRAAERDYLACLSDFGCESGEAYTAHRQLRELRREVLRG